MATLKVRHWREGNTYATHGAQQYITLHYDAGYMSEHRFRSTIKRVTVGHPKIHAGAENSGASSDVSARMREATSSDRGYTPDYLWNRAVNSWLSNARTNARRPRPEENRAAKALDHHRFRVATGVAYSIKYVKRRANGRSNSPSEIPTELRRRVLSRQSRCFESTIRTFSTLDQLHDLHRRACLGQHRRRRLQRRHRLRWSGHARNHK